MVTHNNPITPLTAIVAVLVIASVFAFFVVINNNNNAPTVPKPLTQSEGEIRMPAFIHCLEIRSRDRYNHYSLTEMVNQCGWYPRLHEWCLNMGHTPDECAAMPLNLAAESLIEYHE